MPEREDIVERLAAGGFVAPEEEADELLAAAAGADVGPLLERRLTGEPLAWITGRVEFGGLVLAVAPGVYVPRWHTMVLAERAAARLPDAGGVAVDVATGCGALAAVLGARRPGARVFGTDIDVAAVACARANGVDARVGDLFEPLAGELAAGEVDVVCGTVPYVPTDELGQLQRDTFTFETALAYDGGAAGVALLAGAVAGAAALLRPDGALVLGLAGGQPEALDLGAFTDVRELRDEDGFVRGIEATRS